MFSKPLNSNRSIVKWLNWLPWFFRLIRLWFGNWLLWLLWLRLWSFCFFVSRNFLYFLFFPLKWFFLMFLYWSFLLFFNIVIRWQLFLELTFGFWVNSSWPPYLDKSLLFSVSLCHKFKMIGRPDWILELLSNFSILLFSFTLWQCLYMYTFSIYLCGCGNWKMLFFFMRDNNDR